MTASALTAVQSADASTPSLIDPTLALVQQRVVAAYTAAPLPRREHMVAQLVGKLYKEAPLRERSHLLEHLMRPLGVLSLMAVANGLFANIRFRSGWPDLRVALEDASRVQSSDVVSLVDYVQQVSAQAVDDLAHLISTEPMMAGSAVAAVLVSILLLRARNRRAGDLIALPAT